MHSPEMHVFGDEAFAAYGRNVTWFLSRQQFKFHRNILLPTLFVRPPCPLKYENGATTCQKNLQQYVPCAKN